MRYKVIRDFSDRYDNRHVYRAGDFYPRTGVKVSEERVAELSSTSNLIGKILIEKIEEKPKAKKPAKKSKKKE